MPRATATAAAILVAAALSQASCLVPPPEPIGQSIVRDMEGYRGRLSNAGFCDTMTCEDTTIWYIVDGEWVGWEPPYPRPIVRKLTMPHGRIVD